MERKRNGKSRITGKGNKVRIDCMCVMTGRWRRREGECTCDEREGRKITYKTTSKKREKIPDNKIEKEGGR